MSPDFEDLVASTSPQDVLKTIVQHLNCYNLKRLIEAIPAVKRRPLLVYVGYETGFFGIVGGLRRIPASDLKLDDFAWTTNDLVLFEAACPTLESVTETLETLEQIQNDTCHHSLMFTHLRLPLESQFDMADPLTPSTHLQTDPRRAIEWVLDRHLKSQETEKRHLDQCYTFPKQRRGSLRGYKPTKVFDGLRLADLTLEGDFMKHTLPSVETLILNIADSDRKHRISNFSAPRATRLRVCYNGRCPIVGPRIELHWRTSKVSFELINCQAQDAPMEHVDEVQLLGRVKNQEYPSIFAASVSFHNVRAGMVAQLHISGIRRLHWTNTPDFPEQQYREVHMPKLERLIVVNSTRSFVLPRFMGSTLTHVRIVHDGVCRPDILNGLLEHSCSRKTLQTLELSFNVPQSHYGRPSVHPTLYRPEVAGLLARSFFLQTMIIRGCFFGPANLYIIAPKSSEHGVEWWSQNDSITKSMYRSSMKNTKVQVDFVSNGVITKSGWPRTYNPSRSSDIFRYWARFNVVIVQVSTCDGNTKKVQFGGMDTGGDSSDV